MTLVDATTGEVLASMTPAEARSLTETIKASVDTLWSLLRESHDRGAWRALGYSSWREYATTEFGMSQSRAYQLLDQAKVITEIEAAADSTMVEISEREARDLKPVLKEAVAAVKEAITDAPSAEEKQERVRKALDDLRDTMVEQRRPKAAEPVPVTPMPAVDPVLGYRARATTERSKVTSGLTTLDPARVVATTDHPEEWADFARVLRSWLDDLEKHLKGPRLKAVN